MFRDGLRRFLVLVREGEAVLDRQYEERRREHHAAHDEVTEVERTRVRLDPAHHVWADPAAEIAAGIDEGDGASRCRARQECRRNRPPDTHRRMDADGREADEHERDRRIRRERREREAERADHERQRDMPDLVARLRRRPADDELHEKRDRHRDRDGTAEELRRPAGQPRENR